MRYTILVPTKDSAGEYLDESLRKKALERTLESIVKLTGGVTTTKGKGHWKNKEGRLISEEVTVVETYTDAEHFRIELLGIAQRLKDRLSQESVAYTVGSKLELI